MLVLHYFLVPELLSHSMNDDTRFNIQSSQIDSTDIFIFD